MQHSDNINELAAALAKAQGNLKDAHLNQVNPFFKSKYADLQSIYAAIRKELSANGLSVYQAPEIVASNQLSVATMLMHSSGQWLRSSIEMTLQKHDPQYLGSCITYLRRYSLAACVGISAAADDDAEGAMERPKPFPPAPPKEEVKEVMTVDKLIDKMTTATNLFELTARAKKYRPDYDLLAPEDQLKVRKAKDIRSTQLKEEEKKKKEDNKDATPEGPK